MPLNTNPTLADPDAIYARLIAMHEGRSEADSARINARLIMLLINQVGDDAVVLEAIDRAWKEPTA